MKTGGKCFDAVILHSRDNVATALRPLAARSLVTIGGGESVVSVRLVSDVPFGHKFAVRRIARGGRVVKYGETIGAASPTIAEGDYAHVHNVKSLREKAARR